MQGFKTTSSQLGMNFLLLLFFRLFLSWPPAGKVVSKKARDAGRGCGECPVNGSPSFPGRPHAHSIPTFCFILLAALRLPVLEEAREDECVLELIPFFQDPITLWLWNHHLSESHDSGPFSAFIQVGSPQSTSQLTGDSWETRHSLLQHRTKDLPFTLVRWHHLLNSKTYHNQ